MSSPDKKIRLSDPESVTVDEIMEILQSSLQKSNCCHGKNKFSDMIILAVIEAPIYRYSIEVFSEDRRKQWATVPYQGEPISQENLMNMNYDPRRPPDIWTQTVLPEVYFGKGKKTVEVPGSTTVVPCAQCAGIGSIQCGTCGGTQSTPCSSCVGYGYGQVIMEDGTAARIACPGCGGNGRIACITCGKKGICLCTTCKGYRRVKNYEKLDVIWKTSFETYNRKSGRIQLPQKVLSTLRGTLIVENTSPIPTQLKPFEALFSNFLEMEINKHNLGPNHRIIEIRQRVYSVPGTEVNYFWKGSQGTFLIYGHDNHVHFPSGYDTNKYKCNIL